MNNLWFESLPPRALRTATQRLGLLAALWGTSLLLGCQSGEEAGTSKNLNKSVQSADLVLRNGTIVTVDDNTPRAQAIAVRGEWIVAIGSNDDIDRFIGDQTEVINLDGKLVIPGFIEGHGHFTGIGSAMQRLNLMHVRNWQEVVEMVAAAAADAKPGEWITGRGWHQEKWDSPPPDAVEGFPTHNTLSAVSPNNPVMLTHASGHATICNAVAMELAGVNDKTENPVGGEIIRNGNGQPIGVFRERASGLVSRAYSAEAMHESPAEAQAGLERTIKLADRECLAKGVTSFQDAGSSFELVDVFKSMIDRGELRTRPWVMIRAGNLELAANMAKHRMVDYGNHQLTVRALKRSIDGALGSRGAWLLAPYSDLPTSSGLNTVTVEGTTQMARLAMKHDYQVCIHAIGDRANREVLDIFEKVFAENPGKKDLRWRIEHAQHLDPADIPRFGKLGVVASMQGVHCTSDAGFVIARLGAQRAEQGAYVWKSLMQSGALVTNGTDAPVEDVSPIASFYASVSRRLADGSVFFPKQRMTRMEALRSYTINGAKAAFEEDIKGSLTAGKLADIVVLSQNIMTCPEIDIPNTKVLYTIVGGNVEYQAPQQVSP